MIPAGMLALSIRQPWAWLIVRPDFVQASERQEAGRLGLLKDVENRAWGPRQPGRPQNFRGEFLIHAAQGCTPGEYEDARCFAEGNGVELPPLSAMERGGIVGIVEATAWVRRSESPWFCGPGALVLRNARPLPFVPCRGSLGFFLPTLVAKPASGPDLFSGLGEGGA